MYIPNKIKNKNIRFDFSGKNVIIVGGSKGIGKSLVLEFLIAGAKVYYLSRTAQVNVSDDARKKAIHVQCDIQRESQIKAAFSQLDKQIDQIHFIINVAGTNLCESIDKIDSEEWDRVLDINLKAFFITCKYAVERMIPFKEGRIINVSSIAGRHRSIVSGVHYTSSKAGIIGLTKQLSYEVAKYNILVNAVCPSQTMTEMLEKSMTESQLSELSKNIPIRRIATVTEQALPILFLCSDAASYITGATIDINGGQY